MPTAQHRNFGLGIVQDEASFLLNEGAVYSSKSMLYDKLGVARKRGGLTGVGATTTYDGDHLGFLLKDDGTSQAYSYGKAGAHSAIDITTGTYTSFGGVTATVLPDGGRPFQHYGFLIWPAYMGTSAAFQTPTAVAGATGSVATYTLLTPASCVITAGDKRVVCAAGDNPLTKMQVGQILVLFGGVTTLPYIGRITALIDSTHFEVYPTPTVTRTASAASTNNSCWGGLVSVSGTSFVPYVSGKVGMSFQGRAVLGNIARTDITLNRLEIYPRRVWFSSTLLEGDATGFAQYQGATWLSPNGYPTANYFDVPGSDAITAMSPTGFGDAVIFSAYRSYRLTGNLSTQYGTSQSVTWAVREIPNSVGCISERALQRTPKGVLFAHDSGVYATDGSSMQPLMFNRVSNAWRALVAGASFKIYGSALIRGNHYYICGISGGVLWGWLLNLDTLAWSYLAGKTSTPASWIINSGVQDPVNPSNVWGTKWWDQSGASASMTGGSLVKLEQMFSPSSSSRSDSDGTLVNFEVVTRPYHENQPTVPKSWRAATVEYANKGGANVTVTPATVLDAANLPAGGTFSYLPRQDVYTITAATNAAPIVVTCGAHDIKVDSYVIVQSVTGNTAANGPWRVQAVSATTVTLVGSGGNAAYVSGGTIQNIDQRDIGFDTVGFGVGSDAGAVVYRINDTDSGGAGGADSFELQGITHSWDERDPHAE